MKSFPPIVSAVELEEVSRKGLCVKVHLCELLDPTRSQGQMPGIPLYLAKAGGRFKMLGLRSLVPPLRVVF